MRSGPRHEGLYLVDDYPHQAKSSECCPAARIQRSVVSCRNSQAHRLFSTRRVEEGLRVEDACQYFYTFVYTFD
jgi:hypothetical protein